MCSTRRELRLFHNAMINKHQKPRLEIENNRNIDNSARSVDHSAELVEEGSRLPRNVLGLVVNMQMAILLKEAVF